MQISAKMKNNKFGQIIYNDQDLCDIIMSGLDILDLDSPTVDHDIDIYSLSKTLDLDLQGWHHPCNDDISVENFDQQQQRNWYMPSQYRDLDIAQHVLSLCKDQTELQRAGQELLMFQERGLFDLLRYLVYLVDVMRQNNIVWGVGRGSSVASFVLYLLGVHRINSIEYDLDPGQFLR